MQTTNPVELRVEAPLSCSVGSSCAHSCQQPRVLWEPRARKLNTNTRELITHEISSSSIKAYRHRHQQREPPSPNKMRGSKRVGEKRNRSNERSRIRRCSKASHLGKHCIVCGSWKCWRKSLARQNRATRRWFEMTSCESRWVGKGRSKGGGSFQSCPRKVWS